jgi:hypothetical protein
MPGMTTPIELGVPDVRALPGVAAEPERWDELRRRMHRRVFLRSEGPVIEVGTPQQVSGALLERSIEIVAKMNRFYAGAAAAYYDRPELRAEHLVNPLIEPLLELEADQPIATPLSRLDAVLEADRSLRVIELNSIGVVLIHLRGLLYLIRELARGGFASDAETLDRLTHDTVAGFLRFAEPRLGGKRPVIGSLVPSGWLRGGQLLFRAAFQRAGCDYVFGAPEHLEITDREIRLRGTAIDMLWMDFFLYSAYQHSRYKHTKFPSKVPDFSDTPAQAAAILGDRRFLEHLRSGRVLNISPARAYLALPKSLLSWIHRTDRPVPEEDRAFLAAHVARTYSARDRADGMIAQDAIARDRGDYLVKPCQYGASHGVLLGRMAAPEEWRAKLAEMWDDPTWVVQEFREPVKTAAGEWLSVGLSNFDGVLGGVYLRTSASLLVNARDSGFVPAVLATRGPAAGAG